MNWLNVTKNLQEQVVLQYMFDQYMNVKHLHVIYVKNSLHNKPIWHLTFNQFIKVSSTYVISVIIKLHIKAIYHITLGESIVNRNQIQLGQLVSWFWNALSYSYIGHKDIGPFLHRNFDSRNTGAPASNK